MDLVYSPQKRFNAGILDALANDDSEDGKRSRGEDSKMSHLLDFLNSVCLAVEKRALSEDVVLNSVLGYLIATAYRHQYTRDYLVWVDRERKEPFEEPKRIGEAFKFFRSTGQRILTQMYMVQPLPNLRRASLALSKS